MGACVSNTTESERNQQINRYIFEQKEKEELKSIRVLLLGTGDSGKTTFLKQLKKIHHGIPKEAKQQCTPLIHRTIVTAMKSLCEESSSIAQNDNRAQISNSLEEDAKILSTYSYSPKIPLLPKNIAEVIDRLWKDPGIQYTFKFRQTGCFEDNANYFLDRVLAITSEEYVPTDEDYLHLRSRTTGVIEEAFPVCGAKFVGNNYEFMFVDVGGQKTERKKWISMQHENMKCVLYIVAIGDYDLACFEDGQTNRIKDSLELFRTVLSCGFVNNKSLVLFFNKNDLFVKKICETPITVAFSDYPTDWNPHDEFQVINFLLNKFQSLHESYCNNENNKEPEKNLQSKLHMHRTCALDTNQTEIVITDVQADLLKSQFHSAGMI